jgi:hypothetical protein
MRKDEVSMTQTSRFSVFKKALKAIAEGYQIHLVDDRYILVENPDYDIETGTPPLLLIDSIDDLADFD